MTGRLLLCATSQSRFRSTAPLPRGGGSALALTERFLPAACIFYKGKALRFRSQLALVQLHDLLHAGVAGVAGTAGVRISGLGEELDVLFLQDAVQVCGDAHVSAQLLDSGDGGICGLGVVHLVDALHAHSLADGTIALTGDGLVVLQTDGQQDSAGHAVGGVIQSGQAVCHGVDDAQTHIGEAHAGDVLAQSHALAAFRSVLDSAAQVLTDELDGFQMEHIGDGAVALGDVALDGVGQSIHILPIIGIIKEVYDNSEVYITPTLKEVDALMEIKPEIIAVDATKRIRPDGTYLKEFFEKVKEKYPDQKFMADCSTVEEALFADEIGFDFIGTTLVGYTPYSVNDKIEQNDFEIIRKILKQVHHPVIAEGNIDVPQKARRVVELGCYSVVVGGAITRPQLITKKFTNALIEGGE